MKEADPRLPQWEVHAGGIEAVDRGYLIEWSRLLDAYEDGRYMWPLHLEQKDWVDIVQFCRLFGEEAAKRGADFATLAASIQKALSKRVRRFEKYLAVAEHERPPERALRVMNFQQMEERNSYEETVARAWRTNRYEHFVTNRLEAP